MTFGEFKAWLDGFEESFLGAAPDPDQWAKIREKLTKVEPQVTVRTVPAPHPQPYRPPTSVSGGAAGVTDVLFKSENEG